MNMQNYTLYQKQLGKQTLILYCCCLPCVTDDASLTSVQFCSLLFSSYIL